MANKKILKNLLTTASALAVLAGGVYSASADPVTDDGAGNVTLGNSANNVNVVGGVAAFNNGNSFYFSNANKQLTNNGALVIGAIDLNNKAPHATGFTVTNAVLSGSVIDSGGDNTLHMVVNDNKTLTLTGTPGLKADGNAGNINDYTALGNIELGSGANPGPLTINLTNNGGDGAKTITLRGTIDSNNAAADGIINISADNRVIFNGIIGGVKEIATINLVGAGSKAIFNADVNVANTTFSNATAHAVVGNGVTITGAIDGNGGNSGILEFAGDGTISGTIGEGTSIAELRANGAGDINFDSNVEHKAVAFNLNNVGVQLKLGAGTRLTGNVDGAGKLFFTGAGEVNGLIGGATALGELISNGATEVKIGNGVSKITKVTIVNAGGTFTVDAGGVGKIEGNVTGAGTVKFAGAGEVTGTIGVNGAPLAKVLVNGGAEIKLAGVDHYIMDLDLHAANSTATLGDGAKINGLVSNTQGAANGILNFVGSGDVTGTVGGSGVAALAKIDIKGDEGKLVKIGGNTFATDIEFTTAAGATAQFGGNITSAVTFTQDGIIKIAGDTNHTVTGNITMGAGDAAGKGTIVVDNGVTGARTVEINGTIGGDAADANINKALKIIDAGVAKLKLSGGVVNAKIVRTSGTEIELNNSGKYRFGGIELFSNNITHLKVSKDVDLVGSVNGTTDVNFGTADGNKLASVILNGDKTLIIGDKVNIYANTLTTGVNNGVIEFKGDSIFNAPIGATPLKSIKMSGATGKVARVVSDISTAGAITLDTAGTLQFDGNVTAGGNIDSANAGIGTAILKFGNTTKSTITGTVGAVNGIGTIEFVGTDVDFANLVTHAPDKIFKFSGKTAATVTFVAGTDIGNNPVINESPDGVKHIIKLGQSTVFSKTVGAANKQIIVQGNNAINIELGDGANTENMFAQTLADGKSEVKINLNQGALAGVGANGASVAKLEFTKSGSVTGDVFAKEVTVAQGKVATFGGVLTSDDLKLANSGSKSVFGNGAKLNTKITTVTNGKGEVEFAGNAMINKAIGSAGSALTSVKFLGNDKDVDLNENIYAASIELGNSTYKLQNVDVVLSGTTTAAGTGFYLASKTLTSTSGGITFSGDIDITSNVTINGETLSGGMINVANSSALNYACLNSMGIIINDANVDLPSPTETRTFTIIKNDGTLTTEIDLAKLTVSQTNTLSAWDKSTDSKGNIILNQRNNAVDKLTKALGSKADTDDVKKIRLLVGAKKGSDGQAVLNTLAKLNTNEQDELLSRLNTVSNVINQVLEQTTTEVAANIGTRLGSLVGAQGTSVQNRTVAFDNTSTNGISAGDKQDRYGVWLNPFFGRSTQKARKGATGYKSTSYGASFGFDTKANDDMTIGTALTLMNTEVKHRDYKVGDKTKADVLMFSIYGLQQITDNWFAQAFATFGSNRVNNNESRIVGTGGTTQTATGKYTSMSFSGEAIAGYNHMMDQYVVTPMGGLRFAKVNDGGYKESGTTNQNLDVKKKASNKFEVVVGLRVAGGTFDLNGMSITPEVHGLINHDLIGKKQSVDVRLEGISSSLPTKGGKPNRTFYNVGFSLNTHYNMIEYGLVYDAHLANKYVGHQGSFKIRVNF